MSLIDPPAGATRRSLILAGGAVAAALATGSPVRAAGTARPLPPAWQRAPRLPLWPDALPETGFAAQPLAADYPAVFVRNVARPELRVFVPARPNGRSLLAIPGGAYTFVSIDNEGVAVAQRMTDAGYTVFVLVYRLPGEGWTHRADVPLQDAQRAVRLIRARAGAYGLDPAQLSVVGFSAGGHLAASLATGFTEAVAPVRDAVDRQDARPARVGLVYPVISHEPGVGHAESTRQLLGPAPDAAQVARRSPAAHVTAATPPVFLVHAIDDTAVPVENSLLMLAAMRAAKRPVEGHLFERGGHGFGIGAPALPASGWPDLFLRWIDDHSRG